MNQIIYETLEKVKKQLESQGLHVINWNVEQDMNMFAPYGSGCDPQVRISLEIVADPQQISMTCELENDENSKVKKWSFKDAVKEKKEEELKKEAEEQHREDMEEWYKQRYAGLGGFKI